LKRKKRDVSITRLGDRWVLRLRIDGVHRALTIARAEGRSSYPPKEVVDLAREELTRLRPKAKDVPAASTLDSFFRETYMPNAEPDLKASTIHGYKKAWARYVANSALGQMWIRKIATADVSDFLQEIMVKHDLGKGTLQHMKHLLGGCLRYAVDKKLIQVNPVREAQLPKRAKRPETTKAYSLGEVTQMLKLATDPMAHVIIATAAFAGLRASEIRRLRWSDYEPGRCLHIRRGVWRSFESDPKTDASEASVPLIPQLD
jgi:integrase